jgi:biopolymer transport protein ExbD
MKVPVALNQRDNNVGMMPMIDVVFLLLVFFIWTSSFDLPERDLPGSIAVPPTKTPSESQGTTLIEPVDPFDEIVIRIEAAEQSSSKEGSADTRWTYLLNETRFPDLPSLSRRLTDILSLGVSPAVIVDPDDQTPMKICVAAYDAARGAGADRVLFAAKADEQ